MMDNRQRPQTNRTVLGVLLAILGVAVLLALWFLIFDNDDDAATGVNTALPTPLTVATSTPGPQLAPTSAAVPTSAPAATATAVPEGFDSCTGAQAPLTTTTYIVDTNTTPLNQRATPAVSAEQSGTFPAGQNDLVFTGECVVNLTDGYVWWQIFNGTQDVWVASDFVTPN